MTRTISARTLFHPLQLHKVMAYIFQGYWEDIGTVRAFFEANLALTETVPPYSFFYRLSSIYTRPRFLPASKVNAATFRRAVVGDGCIISDTHIERAVIGIRSIIESGATIRNSVIMGAEVDPDCYSSDSSRED
jgi:glucose-1-phosphate adenylyltransferase